MPPSVALLGAMVVMVGVTATGVTEPFNVKSSKRQVPALVAPEREMTTVMVPVKLFTAFATVVVPMEDPPVEIVPEPTLMLLIVMDQFWAPVVERLIQWSKEVTLMEYPVATANVRVAVGVPLLLFKEIACPVLPAKLVHALILLLQDEPVK